MAARPSVSCGELPRGCGSQQAVGHSQARLSGLCGSIAQSQGAALHRTLWSKEIYPLLPPFSLHGHLFSIWGILGKVYSGTLRWAQGALAP